ncbi:acetate/propionate family kinase [Microbacterium sediminis]|uniref:Acetate kinase n=1 Tax=Microbacterium sediminis TaxID=904291 RepID=A0A1B9N8B8_9MICO|nr:acetate kinase [Microbacterium sediminis]OCG72830.1 acetate kinase [Microbacterium sediminis]QBR73494.1 acetate kinase [Microbacterium sediminis]
MAVVLVVNSGSSSFKYQLLDVAPDGTGRRLASGLVERIGQPAGAARHTVAFHAAEGEPSIAATEMTHTIEREIPGHSAGFQVMLDAFAEHGPSLDENPPVVIGHRVVHGGARFFEATVISDLVEINIDDLSVLAPLHNPGAVQGIRAARRAFGDIPHVAVFDTAFHQTLPAAAATYAIDRELAEKHRIRRYGFHGTSHEYVSRTVAEHLGRDLRELRQIVFHLGNGASVTAIDGGRSVETSMGLTPLEGLVMGTRSGDLDPAVLLHLQRRAGMSTDALDDLLNKHSGVLGLAGVADMRDLHARREAGDAAAQLAFDVYVHRLRSYAGAYLAQLGGVDVISFTAGIGENDPAVRAGALETLGFAGVRIDAERNAAARRSEIARISADDSEVVVLVVPTDEELEIARQSLRASSHDG